MLPRTGTAVTVSTWKILYTVGTSGDNRNKPLADLPILVTLLALTVQAVRCCCLTARGCNSHNHDADYATSERLPSRSAVWRSCSKYLWKLWPELGLLPRLSGCRHARGSAHADQLPISKPSYILQYAQGLHPGWPSALRHGS